MNESEMGLTLKRVIVKACALMLLPIAELIVLRWYLHSFLNLRIGFNGTTDYDYFLPGPLAFFLLIYSLEKGQTSQNLGLQVQPRYLFANVSCFVLFLLLNHFYQPLQIAAPNIFSVFWLGLLVGTVCTALVCFSPLSYFSRNPNRIALVPAVLIAFLLPLYMTSFSSIWKFFSAFTYGGVEWIVQATMENAAQTSLDAENYLILSHPTLALRIGQGCIGLEGLLLFSLVTLTLFLVERWMFTARQWVLIYASGLIYMYGVNLFRIVLLFLSGIALREHLGLKLGTQLFLTVAHAHVGWILYFIAIGFYFFVLRLVLHLPSISPVEQTTTADQH